MLSAIRIRNDRFIECIESFDQRECKVKRDFNFQHLILSSRISILSPDNFDYTFKKHSVRSLLVKCKNRFSYGQMRHEGGLEVHVCRWICFGEPDYKRTRQTGFPLLSHSQLYRVVVASSPSNSKSSTVISDYNSKRLETYKVSKDRFENI